MRFVLVLITGVLFSCETINNIANPGEAYTGTANEPGTRINPYPLSDYYEEYPKSVEHHEVMMDNQYAENELVKVGDSIIYEDVKPDPGDVLLNDQLILGNEYIKDE